MAAHKVNSGNVQQSKEDKLILFREGVARIL